MQGNVLVPFGVFFRPLTNNRPSPAGGRKRSGRFGNCSHLGCSVLNNNEITPVSLCFFWAFGRLSGKKIEATIQVSRIEWSGDRRVAVPHSPSGCPCRRFFFSNTASYRMSCALSRRRLRPRKYQVFFHSRVGLVTRLFQVSANFGQ